ncbi:MAG: DNA repair protein RadC [Lysobacterales bacterium]|jgi:DNA repair protein RadC
MSKKQPREKLAEEGPEALQDDELLAVLLGTGMSRKPVLDVASALLGEFGGFRGLFLADRASLERQPGLGPVKAGKLRAVRELSRRFLGETLQRGHPLESPDSTRDYLKCALRDCRHEVFACLFLDTRHRIIAFEELFRGTIDGATVYPRVVAERALILGAAALIVAHNHPSGVSEPSLADQAITRRLKEALGLLDIRLLDHFVVGDGNPVSMAARGLI